MIPVMGESLDRPPSFVWPDHEQAMTDAAFYAREYGVRYTVRHVAFNDVWVARPVKP